MMIAIRSSSSLLSVCLYSISSDWLSFFPHGFNLYRVNHSNFELIYITWRLRKLLSFIDHLTDISIFNLCDIEQKVGFV